jgi:hypothetical protein
MQNIIVKDSSAMRKKVMEVTGSLSLEGRWIFQGLRVKILLTSCTKLGSSLIFMRLVMMTCFLWLLSIWRERH